MNIQRTSIIVLSLAICSLGAAQTQTGNIKDQMKKAKVEKKEVKEEAKPKPTPKPVAKPKPKPTSTSKVDDKGKVVPAVVYTPRQWGTDKASLLKQHQEQAEQTTTRSKALEAKLNTADAQLEEKLKNRKVSKADYEAKKQRIGATRTRMTELQARQAGIQTKVKEAQVRLEAAKAK